MSTDAMYEADFERANSFFKKWFGEEVSKWPEIPLELFASNLCRKPEVRRETFITDLCHMMEEARREKD